jgi:hypothetical protein
MVISDDTKAVQAALDSMENRGGALLFRGHLCCFKPITIAAPVRISGEGSTRR